MSSLKPIKFLFLFLLAGCGGTAPFHGPGYDADNKKLKTEKTEVVVALTHATLGDNTWRNIDFWWHTSNVVADMENNAGFIGFAARFSLYDGEAWTMTVWNDEQSLDNFVKSDVHSVAMRKGWPAIAKARFARVTMASKEVPFEWVKAEEILDKDGYGSYSMPPPVSN